MEQYDFPSESNLKKGHTLGSLQHAPQWLHWPLRLLDTGKNAVMVLFVLAVQVLLILLAIDLICPNTVNWIYTTEYLFSAFSLPH
jgi:hypothetical protein